MSFFSFPFVSAYDLNAIFSSELKFGILLLLVGLVLFLVFFGILTKLPTFLLLGFFLLFVIGGYIQAGSVLVPSGEVDYIYGNNFTDYHWDDYNASSLAPSQIDREAFLFHEEKVFIPFEGDLAHIIGLFLMVISLFAMLFSIFIGVGGGSF